MCCYLIYQPSKLIHFVFTSHIGSMKISFFATNIKVNNCIMLCISQPHTTMDLWFFFRKKNSVSKKCDRKYSVSVDIDPCTCAFNTAL